MISLLFLLLLTTGLAFVVMVATGVAVSFIAPDPATTKARGLRRVRNVAAGVFFLGLGVFVGVSVLAAVSSLVV